MAEDVLPEYDEWLRRLSATYDAVAYCCLFRLGDRALADRVSARVVAGMIARPNVFRHFGLPYSGRIGHLAEPLIAQAREGALAPGGDWTRLRRALAEISAADQKVFLLSCCEGYDDAALADALGCDERQARERRKHMLELWEDLSRRVDDDPKTGTDA